MKEKQRKQHTENPQSTQELVLWEDTEDQQTWFQLSKSKKAHKLTKQGKSWETL